MPQHPPAQLVKITFAGLLFAAALVGCATPASGFSVPAELTPAQVKAEMANGALILDVREPDEYASGHISGAILIPLGNLPARISALPKDRLIVTVCRTGQRSAEARDLLLKHGFAQVSSMAGGMQDWIAAGYFLQV